MNCVVIGAGAWGTALAVHLDRCGHTVTLVARRLAHAAAIASERENRDYLPGISLRPSIQIGHQIMPSLMEAEAVFFATPSAGLATAAARVAEARPHAWRLGIAVAMCKGLEAETNRLPHGIIAAQAPGLTAALLTGPSHAREVAEGKPTALVLAGPSDCPFRSAVQNALHSLSLRVYAQTDCTGAALGGCLKNTYAIAAGISDGLGLGDNARAALITRALAEMVHLGTALGGKAATFYGLSGAGDLIATCNGAWSRNRLFGEALARDPESRPETGVGAAVVEGYRSTRILARWATQNGVDAPILEQVNAVLERNRSPSEAMSNLMARSPRSENRR